ncbi:MAG: PEGA domain-containing protein [Deltaproteobacteria bacterium]|nr:PEGA domain-containing protein [Deltaproteobacteria bacterium]
MARLFGALCGAVLAMCAPRVFAVPPGGVVVGVDVDLPRLQEALAATDDGQWQVVRLVPAAPPGPRDVQPKLRALWGAYVEADFLRCLALIQDADLSLDRLIEEGQRQAATQAAIVGAACAHGAGSKPLAQQITRKLLAFELDAGETLRRTPPEFQREVQRARQQLEEQGRVTIKVRAVPETSRVELDGRPACVATPCDVNVLAGEHVLVAKHLGFRQRALPIVLGAPQTVTLALDEGNAADTQEQLARALGETRDVAAFANEGDTLRAATQAWSVRVALLLWNHEGRFYGVLYDRALNKRWSQMVVDSGPASARTLSHILIEEWKGVVVPKPFYKHPLFWLSSAVGVALVGGLVWWAAQPQEVKHIAVFR